MSMLARIGYYQVLGKPFLAYLGLTALLLFLAAAVIGHLNMKGNHSISFKWHPIIAKVAIAIAMVHALLAISAYL
jgi:hypothetical protein